jgi:hypothetical protein
MARLARISKDGLMPFLAPFIPAIIGAAGAVGGAVIASHGAGKAADASQYATDQSVAVERQNAQDAARRLDPYVQAGYTGTNALTARLGLRPQTSPANPNGAGYDPTAASAQAQSGASPTANPAVAGRDWSTYGTANPDVQTNWLKDHPATSVGDVNGDGAVDNGDSYAAHYLSYGQGEGRAAPGQIAPTPASVTGNPATYGDSANPTFTDPGYKAPAAYTAPTYTAPGAFSFSIDDFKNNPAYQFALQQGTGQVLASNAATGALKSGAALKALQDRGQQTAYNFYAPERQFAYNQYTDNRNFGRSTFENDRNFGYGQSVDDRNFGRATYDTNRAFNYGQYTGNRDYLTGRADTQTNNLFRLSGMGADAAAGVNAGNANATNGIVNAYSTNGVNQGNAAIAGANATSSLFGSGMNALAYTYGRGQGASPTYSATSYPGIGF